MTLRLTDEETEALRRRAEAEGRSMQDIARQAVREYVASGSHEERVADASRRMIEKWGPVLDRLVSV